MENFKIETKAEKDLLTISGLTEKNELVVLEGFQYIKKTPIISKIATYQHESENGLTKVKVLADHQVRSNEIICPGISAQ